MKHIKFLLSGLVVASLIGCTTNETQSQREESARPRVEQRALSNAIDLAFKSVDFGLVVGKSVFIETEAISKLDIPFISAYIGGLVMERGGRVTKDKTQSDITLYTLVKTSGTDEIKNSIFPDKVRGEFSALLSMLNSKDQSVLKTYELSGTADEGR
jgi:hypothetical protein